MQRTDRTLILIALILLCLSMGAFIGFDYFFQNRDRNGAESIAMVVGGSGDMRVRYRDDLHWQTARHDQKLIFDDAIFAGAGSRVDLKVGKSDLKVDSNTLIVLRKRDLFNTINLNYGTLQGLIASGDKLVVENNGELVEFAADKNTKLIISKKDNNKMSVRVQSGVARVTRNGKVHDITPADTLDIETAHKPDPLVFSQPQRLYFYTVDTQKPVGFTWRYSSGRNTTAEDSFTLEVAEDPAFTRLMAKEDRRGDPSATLAMPAPSVRYVRVKDANGNASETRVITVGPPVASEMLSPAVNAELEIPADQKLPVNLAAKNVAPGGRPHFQVAKDDQFSSLLFDKAVPEGLVELPPGDYYGRVRTLFEADDLASEWSQVRPFTIREPLDQRRMAETGMPYEIHIPNAYYPAHLYGASDAVTQDHVQKMAPFPKFFAAYMRKGYDLMVRRRNVDEPEQKQSGEQFPASWIYPGRTDIVYKVTSRGEEKIRPAIHRLKVILDPAKDLRATPEGQLTWSPLLFAQGYEGELQTSTGETQTFTSMKPEYLASLDQGRNYSYRVRALGRGGKPISDWSQGYRFRSATPVAPPAPEPVEQMPLAQEPEPPRKIASETATSRGSLKVERAWWDRVGAWLWAGSGFNFVLVRQTIASTADVEYKNTKAPSGYLEAGYLNERYGGVVSYKRTPGDVRVDNYPVDRRDFVWTTYSAEGLLPLPWRSSLLSYPLTFGLRAGFQQHTFPFLFVGTGRNLIQGTNNMTTLSLGFFADTIGRLKYHWTMRYQQPLKSSSEGGNQFSIDPVMAFDGSLGASYMLTRNFKTGMFFYGQLHDYKFTYTSASQTNIGKQWLFYSNAELRLGYDF